MEETNLGESIIVNKFTEESARKFRSDVLKRTALDPSIPIMVYVDSYGGCVDALNSMLATMNQVPNKFVTVCIGKAMSCGAVLLSAGDYRFIDENARVMIHQSSSGAIGPTESIQNDVNENKRLNKQFMDFVLGRCNKTMRDFKEAIKNALHQDEHDNARDLYLDPKESLEFGIVDFIGMPLIKPIVQYAIEIAPKKQYELIEKESSINVEIKKISKKKATKKQTRKKYTKTK